MGDSCKVIKTSQKYMVSRLASYIVLCCFVSRPILNSSDVYIYVCVLNCAYMQVVNVGNYISHLNQLDKFSLWIDHDMIHPGLIDDVSNTHRSVKLFQMYSRLMK